MSTQTCRSCSHRKPNDFYSTCTALAAKNWLQAETRLPFWTPFSVIIHKDMTARTLANEGKDCGAYMSEIA